MAKKIDKIVSLTSTETWRTRFHGSYARPWRIQLSAIFWHLLLFLLPSYAVWQGLFVRWQAWFGLILWDLIASFFLFFIGVESLTLKTQEPRRWLFLRAIQSLSGTLRRFSGRKAPNSKNTDSIFGNYANDGKWEDETSDAGVTIEGYLKQRLSSGKTGFDWNWKQNSLNQDESYWVLQKEPSKHLHQGWELLRKYFRANWQQAWQTAFPCARNRNLTLALFWTSVIWLPLSYWLLYSADILQRGGFVSYGRPVWGSLYALLAFANLSLPILAQQVGNKLQRSLSGTVSQMGIVSFGILLELSYSLAAWLIIWLFSNSPGLAGAALLLTTASLYLRLSLRRRMQHSLSLFLFRQLGCLSASLGLLLHLIKISSTLPA